MTNLDPDYSDDYSDEDDSNDGTGAMAKLRKQVREQGKALREANERADANAAAATRVAFQDAGIPNTPQAAFFRDHYSGELSAEAIKAAAISNGFLIAEDHTGEVTDLDRQSQGIEGGELPQIPGDMSQFDADVAEAVARAPRGGENKAIDDVYRRYQRTQS